MFPLDLLAALPEPRDDEPSSLRNDISDELADHLQCAFRREVLKDGNTAAAQQRVLDRFGDPKQLARRLWWQAMRSRIMRQRIVSGLQWLVALTAMLISGAVFWQQSQLLAELRQARQEDAAQRQALTAKLEQLQSPTETLGARVTLAPDQDVSLPTYNPAEVASADERLLAPGPTPGPEIPSGYYLPNDPRFSIELQDPASPPVLTLSFVQDTEIEELVAPASVTLFSSAGVAYQARPKVVSGPVTHQDPNASEPVTAEEVAVKNMVVFPSLEPDLYQLCVVLADGQASERPLSIRDAKPRELTIRCPAPRKRVPLSVSISPLPDKLQKTSEVYVDVRTAPIEIEHAKWTAENLLNQRISFDAASGLPVRIINMSTHAAPDLDLRELPAEERQVFLPRGVVSYQIGMSKRLVIDGGVRVYEWPRPSEAKSLSHAINDETNAWKIELPTEYLEWVQSEIDPAGPVDWPAAAASADGRVVPVQPPMSAEADSKTNTQQQQILGQLQGKWLAVDNGTMMLKGERLFFCFRCNTVCSMRDEKRDDWLPFSMDVAKDPMWIDIDGMKGLFRLEGDSLTICFGIQRPVSLTPEGELVERYVLKRVVSNEQLDKSAPEVDPNLRPPFEVE